LMGGKALWEGRSSLVKSLRRKQKKSWVGLGYGDFLLTVLPPRTRRRQCDSGRGGVRRKKRKKFSE